MGKIEIKDHRFLYSNEKEEKVLIDWWDCIKNKSRISLWSGEESEKQDILKLIDQLQDEHEKVAAGTKEQATLFYMLIDLLAIRVFMKTTMPLHILQIGSMSGILSYHLAVLAGIYNPQSSLCCVCNGIGNESGNYWLDRIALVENPPRLSMLAADYDDTQLQSDYFDLVVVNGTEYFEDPYSVLQEAGRVVKKDGAVLCYASHQPLLADCFRMIFEDCEQYGGEMPEDDQEVLWTDNIGQLWSGKSAELTEREIAEYLQNIQTELNGNPNKEKLRNCISELDTYIERAMEQSRVDFKIQLLEVKGQVLDKMYPAG